MRIKIRLFFGLITAVLFLADAKVFSIMAAHSLTPMQKTLADILAVATVAGLIMTFGKITFRLRKNYRLQAGTALTRGNSLKFFRRNIPERAPDTAPPRG